MAKTYPTQEALSKLLRYDPETGHFLRVAYSAYTSCKKPIGSIVGCPGHRGYIVIKLSSVMYYAHRLAFVAMLGDVSDELQIDHINGVAGDNRWSNLRLATPGQNQQNKINNSPKLMGAIYDANLNSPNKWIGMIVKDRKHHYLGLFATELEAHKAYVKAKAKIHTFNPVLRK